MTIKHLYAVPADHAQAWGQVALSGGGGGRTLYRKDAARVGRYYVPHARMWADISPERIDHWVEQFARFTAAGNSVYFTIDHKPTIEARRGQVVALRREGDRLMFDVRPDDDEAEALIRRSPEVSIEADPEFTDATGTRYRDVITAISAVRHPVITDQQPFVPLAASTSGTSGGGGGTAQGVLLLYAGDTPPDNDGGNAPDPVETPMFTTEQLAQVRKHLGLDDKADQAAISAGILDRLAKPASPDPKLAESEALVAGLKGQVAELSKGKEPEVDTDVLEQTAELVDERLSLLVEKGHITAAIADEARKLMLGAPGSRPKIMLSAKVATAAGLPGALHKPLMELLGKLNMGVKAGQKTGPQVFGLPRETPDGDGRPSAETRKAMADAAYGPSK